MRADQLQKEDERRCGPASEYGRGPSDGDTEEEEVVNAAFALDFTGEICFQESQAPEMSRKVWTKEGLPLVGIRSGTI